MNHFHSVEEIQAFRNEGRTFTTGREFAFSHMSYATIGSYDGVHVGHQSILKPMADQAHAAGAAAVVITFHPHPVVVLRGITQPIYLTTPDERARLMGELGIDAVLTLTFDRALASLTAEAFMEQIVGPLGLKQLWVGGDFALGRNRQGDIPALTAIGQQMGYTVKVVDLVEQPVLETLANSETLTNSGKISSSHIRELIRAGNVAEAALMLGRPYSLEGPVMHGAARGRTLGFPTANVDYGDEKVPPALGVYATWAWVDGTRYPSVTSVGLNPTFNDGLTTPRVEAFLIDYSGDLYDQRMRIEFLEFLRPEMRFHSAEALIDQMKQDTQRAREVLAHAA